VFIQRGHGRLRSGCSQHAFERLEARIEERLAGLLELRGDKVGGGTAVVDFELFQNGVQGLAERHSHELTVDHAVAP
jgi:hypothetical protein